MKKRVLAHRVFSHFPSACSNCWLPVANSFKGVSAINFNIMQHSCKIFEYARKTPMRGWLLFIFQKPSVGFTNVPLQNQPLPTLTVFATMFFPAHFLFVILPFLPLKLLYALSRSLYRVYRRVATENMMRF